MKIVQPDILVTDVRIVTPQGITEGGWMLLREGIIASIGAEGDPIPKLPLNARRLCGGGGYALPGFIDIHVHGGAGCDFMTAGPLELMTITRFHAENGTTAMLATTVTASRDDLSAVLKRVGHFMREPMPYAQLLGVHLEGPFISRQWKGAQNPDHIVQPQPEWLEKWALDFPGIVKLQTLAPELEGANDYIRRLLEHGVVPACGHTGATYEQIRLAADNGLRHAVHTFNAMLPFHHREPGTVGAVLTDRRISAEIIADGLHSHPAAIRLLLQAKGIDGAILVTDAIAAAGMPDGLYELGGLPVIVENGIARLKNSGNLAGSTLSALQGFRYMVEEVGVTIAEASRVASLNPARLLGLSARYGSLESGKRADILLLDGELRLTNVLIGGQVIL